MVGCSEFWQLIIEHSNCYISRKDFSTSFVWMNYFIRNFDLFRFMQKSWEALRAGRVARGFFDTTMVIPEFITIDKEILESNMMTSWGRLFCAHCQRFHKRRWKKFVKDRKYILCQKNITDNILSKEAIVYRDNLVATQMCVRTTEIAVRSYKWARWI